MGRKPTVNLNNALKEANYDDYYKGIDLARGTYITSKRDRLIAKKSLKKACD